MRKLLIGMIAALMAVSSATALSLTAGTPDEADWRAKVDPELLNYMENGILPPNAPASLKDAETITVWIAGDSLPVPEVFPASREGWMDYWSTKSLGLHMNVVTWDAKFDEVELKSFYPVANAGWVTMPTDLVPALAQQNWVARVGMDYVGAVQVLSVDEGWDAGIMNVNEVALTQAPSLHADGVTGAGVLYANIDTGIWPGHEGFKRADGSSRLVDWYATVGCTASPCDDHGHGSHTTGTSASGRAFQDSTHGYNQEPGVAPEADIMGIKFLNSGGGGSWEHGVAALNYAFNNGADVTSNSWGGGGGCPGGGNICDVVNNHALAGLPHVFAAGNSGCGADSVGVPGRAPLAITVSSTELDYDYSSFTSCGPSVDFAAVGSSVRSTVPRSGAPYSHSTGYYTMSGTSMATPAVSGGAALVIGALRDLVGREFNPPTAIAEGSEGELHDLLASCALDLGAAGWDRIYGHGFLQLECPYQWVLGQAAALVTLEAASDVTEMGAGEVNSLTASLKNVRVIDTTGTMTWQLAYRGTEIDAGSTPVDLAGGESYTFSLPFESGMRAPGTYTFATTYTFQWTKYDGTVHTETIKDAVDFKIVRPDVVAAFDIPATVAPGDSFDAVLTLVNGGNANAEDVTVSARVPAGTLLAPDASNGRMNGYTWIGTPAPTRVYVDVLSGETILTYDTFDLAPGEATAVSYHLTAAVPGSATHSASAGWTDARDYEYEASFSETQTTSV